MTDSQLADEYAETRLRVMARRPNVNPDDQRLFQLATELLSRQADQPAEDRLQVQGDKFIVPISPQENKTSIVDPGAVYRIIRRKGNDILLAAYTITLAKVRKLLTEAQLDEYLLTERTGPREIGEPVLKQEKAA
ncbi:MAG: hypothetical protein ABSF62_02500 [Bryobacteraceae bacterium]